MLPELARASKASYEAFREEGFDEKQALYLAACVVTGKIGSPP